MTDKVATPKAAPKHTLVGQNYTTPDLLAKVTGKAKYAEDYRADGMLFVKLLLSPYPHARVKYIDKSKALAMPGVKAIITVDDLPAPADTVTDLGAVNKADPLTERGLTNEPVYQGEPILAVAAVDELTAADAIEKIYIEYEPLPFVIDPLDSLRPNGPNAREQGNVWGRPAPPPNAPPGPPPPLQRMVLKWTDADFAAAGEGQLPMGKATDEWQVGNVDEEMKSAALVLDESFVTPNVSHQCLETRSTMAYWQNGKVYIHTGTQSTFQTAPAIARWLGVDPKDVVFISEYTGGGFGSKITGGVSLIIPALLSKRCNAPVMMRISREEEQYIGRGRPSLQGRLKVGFSKEGKVLAIDMFVICDNGPYEQMFDATSSGWIVSLLFQPKAMRWRGLTVLTNTVPRSAQSSPGGMQGITLMEPIVAKAARKLGVDQVQMRLINAPEGKAEFGQPFGPRRQHTTSCFLKDALDQGAKQFKWDERVAQKRRNGPKSRGLGVAVSTFFGGGIGYDGLIVLKPDGKLYIQSGIGNHGTESVSDSHRVSAEVLGVPWEQVELTWGNTSKNLPFTCASGGSQTTHCMTRAAYAAGLDAKAKLQQIAAKDLGGKPEQYEVANQRVFRKGGGPGMTLAHAAQRAIALGGIYDGHELPKDINKATVVAATALAGQGLMGVAKDSFPRDGTTMSFVASFAEVEVDMETGEYQIVDFLGYADAGTIVHPAAFGGQVLGRSMLGISHAIGAKWVYDKHYGVPVAKRFHHTRPPTILDAPTQMAWGAVGLPDPETPVGARGIGEPPVGGGCSAILNAIADAVGVDIIRRAPINADLILTGLETKKPVDHNFAADV